ncbi:MAG: hypothetical protein WDA11_10285 [Thiohalomonadaceae bacterium]
MIAMKGDVTMHKKICGILFILLCFALLPACQNESVNGSDTMPVLDLSSSEKLTFKPGSKDTFSVKVYDIDVPEGWSAGGVFPYNSKIYYYRDKVLRQLVTSSPAEVVEYDTGSHAERVIYSCENNDTGLFLNELMANENSVFWSVYEGHERRIERYDFKNEKIALIDSSPADSPAMLSADGNHMIWFQASYEESGDDLYVYDSSNGILEHIEVAKGYLYRRSNINEGVLTYVTVYDDQYNLINICDLNTKEVIKGILIDKNIDFMRTIANRQYFVFNLPQQKDEIYAYDYVYNILYDVNDLAEISVFSFELINDTLLINDNESKTIIALNLADQTQTVCFGGDGRNHRFTSSSASQNKTYATIDHDFANEKTRVVYITVN